MIHVGDCLAILPTLPAESVQTCITSPPYFGLRDYGCAGQIGLEATPAEFVAAMVAVFREVRRVLRDDGTLWLNLGDSYAGSRAGPQGESGQMADRSVTAARCRSASDEMVVRGKRDAARWGGGNNPHGGDIKPKDLCGIPWMVAFALRADGWYLRQDIIWAKPNPMPESVKDRCTKSHEYLFLLTKSERYYFDSDAIAEAQVSDHGPGNRTHKGATAYEGGATEHRTKTGLVDYSSRVRTQTKRAVQLATEAGLTDEHIAAIRAVGITDTGKARHTQDGCGKNDPAVQALADEAKAALGGYYREFLIADRRNKRSVWTVATQPFKEAHFATYPPALIEPCVLAGSRPGDVVLDPFMGAGTTAVVASKLGRQYVGCELNPEYARIAEARLRNTQPGLPLEAA